MFTSHQMMLRSINEDTIGPQKVLRLTLHGSRQARGIVMGVESARIDVDSMGEETPHSQPVPE